MPDASSLKGTVVQIASYNTNLQGDLGVPQDLVDWLSPTLTVSNFLSRTPNAPDIVAVGFQELLPLHLGFCGLSKSVIKNRDALIRSQVEAHAPNREGYSLVAHEVFVGVAILVYARDSGIGRRVCDVQTSWTGCGPAWMGNKGAVGVRFRVKEADGGAGEVFTFVNAHLTAHAHNLRQRIKDWNHISTSLLFPSPANPKKSTTIYASSHLFFLGDLNFRLDIPTAHPLRSDLVRLNQHLSTGEGRAELKEYDQLLIERRKGTIFQGMSEAEFWQFKCSYKFKIGTVDQYSTKRTPSWTDRILYATYTDSPDTSKVIPLLYTSIPSYTTSDHKPIVALLIIPPPISPDDAAAVPIDASASVPLLRHSSQFKPDAYANLKRYTGKVVGRIIGVIWFVFVLLGFGNAALGVSNVIFGTGALAWWRKRNVDAV
ncbi:inositol polyphosphate phosphatase [Hysterangium stoloniferum]|nr:inositol polyphosphate phosphatase [Hysterangium stoloniferum]